MKSEPFQFGVLHSLQDFFPASEDERQGVIYTIVDHSNTIEGIYAPWVETMVVGEESKPNYEFWDHIDAFQYALERFQQAPTEHDVKEIHRILMQHQNYDGPGEYHTEQGYIHNHGRFISGNPVPEQVPGMMQDLCAHWNDASTLEGVLNNHYHFLTIHPFGDGNGRTGRILLNWQALRKLGQFVTIFESHRPEYYDAIKKFRAQFAKDHPETTFVTYEMLGPREHKRLADIEAEYVRHLSKIYGA